MYCRHQLMMKMKNPITNFSTEWLVLELVAALQDYFQSKCISWDSSWSKLIRNFMLDEPSFEDGISLLNLCIDMRTPIPIHNS